MIIGALACLLSQFNGRRKSTSDQVRVVISQSRLTAIISTERRGRVVAWGTLAVKRFNRRFRYGILGANLLALSKRWRRRWYA